MVKKNFIEVREMIEDDVKHLVNYWVESSEAFLEGMGVAISKRPTGAQIKKLVLDQLEVPINKRKSYYVTWVIDNLPAGYANINQIEYGEQAFMHIHLWHAKNRKNGHGIELIKQSLPYFFENFELQQLFCEPYASNPAPNGVVEKVGFDFVKQHLTIPGASNFEQLVNRWVLTRSKYEKISQ